MRNDNRFTDRITEPSIKEVKEIIKCTGWIHRYVLKEKRFCPLCHRQTNVELISLVDYDYWFTKICAECTGMEKKVYKRQTMPFCEECNEHFKIGNFDLSLKVYDETGHRICKDCMPKFLKELRNEQIDISPKINE